MAFSDYKTREEIINKRGYEPNIAGDMFSLYISSYPTEVSYLGRRIGNKDKTFVELCCGIGVTLTGLAKYFKTGLGVDIDRHVVEDCTKNITSQNLTSKITIKLGNITNKEVLQDIKADIAIYDIPFWSPYSKNENNTLSDKNPDLKELISNIETLITKNIVIFCSPEFTYDYIKKILDKPFEYEEVYINSKKDRNFVYLGNLVHKIGKSSVEL